MPPLDTHAAPRHPHSHSFFSGGEGCEWDAKQPTDVGMVVNDFLIEYFPNIIDYNFTAKVENEFDDVAEGTLEWTESIDKFYTTFHPNVESVSKLRLDRKVCELLLGNDPKSGKPVSVKITRFAPAVQLGNAGDKPRFASLSADQSMQTITMEEALMLFESPRSSVPKVRAHGALFPCFAK